MEVMLGEHKARVTNIQGHPRLFPWLKGGEDTLVVWLELDPPVDYLISFPIDLAVKDYSREEFLTAVSRLGEIALTVRIELMAKEQPKREMIKEAKARVDLVASKLREMFEI